MVLSIVREMPRLWARTWLMEQAGSEERVVTLAWMVRKGT